MSINETITRVRRFLEALPQDQHYPLEPDGIAGILDADGALWILRRSDLEEFLRVLDEISGCLPIEELALNTRAYNRLRRCGIWHIGDLVDKSEGDLTKMNGLGRISIENIKTRLLEEFGLRLRQDTGEES